MSDYTKGAEGWNVNYAQPYDEHEFEVSYDTEDGLTYPIADVHGKLENGSAEANAHLIAAAPELYEALKNTDNAICYACERAKDCNPWECTPHVARMDAINKAEGKS